MSTLDNAIRSINTAADRTTKTTEFVDQLSTYDDISDVTNPNTGETVPSLQKKTRLVAEAAFAESETQINQAVSDAELAALAARSAANYDTEFVAGVTSAIKGKSYLYSGSMWACLNDTSSTPSEGNANWYSLNNHSSLTDRDKQGAHPASAIDGVVEVFDTVADIKSATWLRAGQLVKTKGYYAIGDGGQAQYLIQTSAEFGDVIDEYGDHTLSNGLVAVMQSDGNVNTLQFGVVGVGNEKNKIQAVVDKARKVGVRGVSVGTGMHCPTKIEGIGDVFFVGSNIEITGDGLYRKKVFSGGEGCTPTNLLSKLNFKIANRKTQVKAVLTGSSTGTFKPDAIDFASSLYHKLKATLVTLNPSKHIEVINRAIGAQTYVQLNSKPTSFPTWYTDNQRDWLEYINDEKPDVVFIVMGSNDKQNFNFNAFTSVVDKIKSFTEPCDIVFITQPAPSLNATGTFAADASKKEQEGRDYSAGAIRTYSQYYGYGCVDANRVATILCDGMDVLNTASKSVEQGVQLNGSAFVAQHECRDYSMFLTFVGGATEIDNAFNSAVNVNNPPRFRLGAGSGDSVFLRKHSSTGTVWLQFFATNLGAYKSVITDIPFPASSFSVEVTVKNNILTVSFAGNEDTMRVEERIIRHGGVFKPSAVYFANTTSSPWKSLDRFSIGEEVLYTPVLTHSEMWGESTSSASRKLPYGGNGINHLSSIGNAAVWDRLLGGNLFLENDSEGFEFSGEVTALEVRVTNIVSPYNRCIIVGSAVIVHGYTTLTLDSSGGATVLFELPVPRRAPLVQARISGNWATLSQKCGVVFGESNNDKLVRIVITDLPAGSTSVHYTFSYSV